MAPQLTLFAPAPLGLETLLAQEITSLGASRVRAARAGVSFEGTLEVAYRVCLWSRLASRVLMRIAEVPATSPEELYDSIAALPWEEHLGVDGTLAVDFTASRSPITHTKYGALKVKDAIVDRFREREGDRPNVDTVSPDVRVNVAARLRSAVVSIDLAGTPLHRRGYREQGIQVGAPLKETLAAAVLIMGGWPEIAARGATLLDPMCGSGTLAIEGAMIAGDRAPGLLRDRWGFDGWSGHDTALWDELLAAADERAEAGLASIPPVFASDDDPRAVSIATACVKRAGLAERVTVVQADALEGAPPGGAAAGLVVVNPPYGERLGEGTDIQGLYRSFGARMRAHFAGWRVAMIASDDALVAASGLPLVARHEVYNGRIPASVSVFEPGGGSAGRPVRPVAGAASSTPGRAGSAVVQQTDAGVPDSMFANRLRKNAKRLGKWARREGVTCFRLYDADMPEYAVAIDRYEGAAADEGRVFAHVAEYAPPADIEPASAQRRLSEVMEAVPRVLGLDPADVHLKVRRRQKGSAQYGRHDARAVFNTVAEDGLLFEVNFTDYLDTGLFLDHRITRRMVHELAPGARFLNLFAYTGAVTVFAAAGHAASSLTVDMSQTYLDWAKRNMAANGFTARAHAYLREDVLAWLDSSAAAAAGPFELIFLDPPTFSASKRMDATFDVQRDHVRLIGLSAALLASGGTLLFSNNFRKFRLDQAALSSAGLIAEEITKETIPEDFARNPRVHSAWRITRG